jgi:hypothetical protein
MKQTLSKGYRISENTRWITVALFTFIAGVSFGVRFAIFTMATTLLAHEIPTLVMGVYIAIKVKKGGHDIEETDIMD